MDKEYLESIYDLLSNKLNTNSRNEVQVCIKIIYKNTEFWQVRVIEGLSIKRFDTFREFITYRSPWGLGWTLKVAEAFIMPELKEIWKVIEGEVPEVNKKGGDRKSDNIKLTCQTDTDFGNSRDYRIALLKRDAPEIANQVINREISAAEGMRRAGKAKAKVTHDATVDGFYNAIQKKLNRDQIKELIQLLNG